MTSSDLQNLVNEVRDYTHIITHAGKFHADDVMSVALMQILTQTDGKCYNEFFTPTEKGVRSDSSVQWQIKEFLRLRRCKYRYNYKLPVIRTADDVDSVWEEVVEVAQKDYYIRDAKVMVLDIGKGRFDHHQVEQDFRANGVPYASFGKIWRTYGAVLFGGNEEKVAMFDHMFVEEIDNHDCTGAPSAIGNFIEGMNQLNPIVAIPEEVQYAAFMHAVDFAVQYLEEALEQVDRRYLIVDKIKTAECWKVTAPESSDPATNVAIFNFRVEPDYIHDVFPEVDVAIYPHERGGYAVRGLMRPDGTQWRISDVFLAMDTQTKEEYDLRFIHKARFIACFNTLESAINGIKVTVGENAELIRLA